MDISAANWNEDDNANSTAAPDGAPEGMAPSGVNNVLRAMMGATKRWFGWSNPKATGGTGTAYTLSYTVSPGALVDGMTHLVQFHAANGAAPTLNVNALGAIPIHYFAAGAWWVIPAGLIGAGELMRVAYNTAAGAYRLVGFRNHTGEIVPFAGSATPPGVLLCFGQAVSRTTYAGLFNTVGTQYGAGDGSTTFNVPDLRGRVAAGKDDMGGSAASRITATTVPNSPNLGATGGSQSESTTVSVTGSATGTLTGNASPSAVEAAAAASGAGASRVDHDHAVSVSGILGVAASGSTAVVTNVQPTIILNYLIRI